MDRNPQFEAAFSDLANALTVALPLAERQARVLGDAASDSANLAAAVERAARAVRQLRRLAAGMSR